MMCAGVAWCSLLWMSDPITALGQTEAENPIEPPTAHARPNSSYDIRSWTTDDGLPQNSITDIVQTRDGYIWVTTFAGLARFDGMHFEVFNVGNSPGLVSNRMVHLFESRDGVLWIGHEEGGLTLYEHGAFSHPVLAEGTALTGIPTGFAEDSIGTLWIGTTQRLYKYVEGKLHQVDDAAVPRGMGVRGLVAGADGTIWFSVGDDLYSSVVLKLKGGQFTQYAFNPLRHEDWALEDEGIRHLLVAPDGTVYVHSAAQIWRLDGNTFEAIYPCAPQHEIRDFLFDAFGNLWVADARGLFSIPDASTRRVESSAGGEVFDYLLRHYSQSLLEDREGNLWFGTMARGLFRLKKKTVLRYLFGKGDDAAAVYGVVSDGKGGVWFGAGINDLSHFRDGVRTVYAQYFTPPFSTLQSLLHERQGALWVAQDGFLATWKDGITLDHTDRLPGDESRIDALYEDRSGHIWMGRGGLIELDGDHTHRYGTEDGLVGDHIRCITEGADGSLWIGTHEGVSRFKNGAFTNFTRADGLPPGTVRAIYEDADRAVWIGTYGGGLARLKDGQISRISRDNGLCDDVVSCILEDDEGNLWMLGNLGLYFASRKNLNEVADGVRDRASCILLGSADGMTEGNGVVQPAGGMTDEGVMYFATIDGLAVIDTKQMRINDVPAPVVIQRVLINNENVAVDASVTMSPGKRDLELHFAGLSFVAPENVQYRYRLEGYKDDWIHAGTRRAAYYTNLPPGSYTFHVIACNNHGVWNTEGASLAVVVEPAVWQTGWFRVLALLLAIGGVAGGVYLRDKNIRRRQCELETLVTDRTRDLLDAREHAEAASTAKSMFLARMSHELRTPLTTILGYAQVMDRDVATTPKQNEYLRTITRSGEHLLDMINDVLDMSKIDAGHLTFEESSFDLYELLGTIEGMMGLRAREKGLQLVFDTLRDVPRTIRTDERKLRQVFINLLGNAVKFTNKGSIVVRVRFAADETFMDRASPQPGRLLVEIEDTGPGIAEEEMEALFSPFFQTGSGRGVPEGTGLGLSISRRFVQLMGGDIRVTSTLGRGSVFVFDMPVLAGSWTQPEYKIATRRVVGLAPGQKPCRILVAEDVDVARMLLVELCASVGLEVREARNGLEAVKICKAWQPDLVWMDVNMPVMNGMGATRRIKAHAADGAPVVIAITASAFAEVREAILECGCDDFLAKPYRDSEIYEMMRRHLGLKYEYGNDAASTFVGDSGTGLTSRDFTDMPRAWVSDLHQAAVRGDVADLRRLVDQIDSDHPSLARTLSRLMSDFQFNLMIAATAPICDDGDR